MGGARNWKEGSLSWREDILSKGAWWEWEDMHLEDEQLHKAGAEGR